jgi:hypothetical protein
VKLADVLPPLFVGRDPLERFLAACTNIEVIDDFGLLFFR